ncbi:MAG: hypothetical protein EB120_11560 [Proteobacteria bacterium]|nr:hypothetical protein [Pseudomonadota bacterium]
MAKVALISSIALVLTGLLGILIQKAQVALFLKRSAGLLGLVTSVVLLLTASRGGPIRHTEIRDSVQSAPAETRDEPAEQEDSPDEGDEI